jgi:methanogenic corrinoid protein MtbC1
MDHMDSFPVTAEALDRASAIPLHYQLATILRTAIAHGRLRAGRQLPAEKELAVQLGLARGTVRQAIDRLVREGLLLRRHGWGTFVAAGGQEHHEDADGAAAAELQAEYLRALLTGDAGAAHRVVTQALHRGFDANGIAEVVLRPAAYAVGEHWHDGDISVADEHRATAIIGRDLAELHRLVPWLPPVGRMLVIGCVAGELHALGSRIVADHFERTGWTVHYLGPDVPTDAFSTLAQRVDADLIAVSAMMPENVPGIAVLIQALRRQGDGDRPVLVGGLPFVRDPHLAQSLGAWAQASTAEEAVRRASTHFADRAARENRIE